MKRGFSLLEILIVLTIISVGIFVALPTFYSFEKGSWDNFENQLKTAAGNLFSLSKPSEICVNFKDNYLKLGGEKILIPQEGKVEYLVFQGSLVSSDLFSKYCTYLQKPEAIGILIKKENNTFLSILILFPAGEVIIKETSLAESESLKDKILKGRVLE
ncbi:MAG: type II secretion system protein [Desulfurobacteriaceae bacterium]